MLSHLSDRDDRLFECIHNPKILEKKPQLPKKAVINNLKHKPDALLPPNLLLPRLHHGPSLTIPTLLPVTAQRLPDIHPPPVTPDPQALHQVLPATADLLPLPNLHVLPLNPHPVEPNPLSHDLLVLSDPLSLCPNLSVYQCLAD